MDMRTIMDRAAHACETPGAQFHIRVSHDQLGAIVDLPDEVRLDLDQDDAEAIEDQLHNALEAAVGAIVDEYDEDAADHWKAASERESGLEGLSVIEAMTFGRRPIFHTDSISAIAFEGNAEVEDHVRAIIEHFRGQGYREVFGRLRTVFFRDRTVVKVPVCFEGCMANTRERRQFELMLAGEHANLLPVAACRTLMTKGGINLLMMRTVEPVTDYKDLPSWTDWVDGQQVGYNPKGELVAYDL